MDHSTSTFLDYPIDKELYVSKQNVETKAPIRILVTDASYKYIYTLIYKICCGDVFGEHQPFYINIVITKGLIDPHAIFLEIEECGFHLLKGWLVTSDTEEAFSNVDVAILTNNLEEQPGISMKETFLGQLIRMRQTARYLLTYANPDVKIVIVGSSTKFSLLIMNIFKMFETTFKLENITAVTALDTAIAKAHLAAKLKTTTNKIRNIVIWGFSVPDTYNATVYMIPPGDFGTDEEVKIHVSDAVEDGRYLVDDFVKSTRERKIGLEFTRSGKSIAYATARHLKALFQGVHDDDDIFCMGVFTPESNPYSFPSHVAISYPVSLPGEGICKIKADIRYNVTTHLFLLKSFHRLKSDKAMISLIKAIRWLLEYEEKKQALMSVNERHFLMDMIIMPERELNQYIGMLPLAAIPVTAKEKSKKKDLRKSIIWNDKQDTRKETLRRKSSIRFDNDKGDDAPSIKFFQMDEVESITTCSNTELPPIIQGLSKNI